MGGKRICFGKTFAEATIKILVTYFTQMFNIEFVDERFKTEFPNSHFGISKREKIEVILRNKEKLSAQLAK